MNREAQKVQSAPSLRRFRRWMFVSIFISIVPVVLLLWNSKMDWPSVFQSGEVTESQPGNQTFQEEKFFFIPVNGTKTLLMSAYVEHRKEPRQVRVFAVVLRSEAPAYRCLLRCEEQLRMSEGVATVHSDHFGFPYGTSHIMCPIPSGCQTPSQITVTLAATRPEESHEAVFLKVQNQESKTSFRYTFTVCLSTMFDFTNVLQLVQELEMFRLLGVDRVVVYKTGCSPETQRVLDYYVEKGFLEVIPWTISQWVNVSRGWLPLHGPGDIHYLGQIPALNDCIYRYMYQSKYMALQDTDELILPQAVNSWPDLLPLLEKEYGADKCYMFENNVFHNTVSLPPPASEATTLPAGCCDSWKKVPGVNILAHLHHEPSFPETGASNFKIIVNPRAVFSPTVHGLLESQKGCSWVNRNIARLYHTRAPWHQSVKPEQLIYDGRILSYSAKLTPAINAVLTHTGFLTEESTA